MQPGSQGKIRPSHHTSELGLRFDTWLSVHRFNPGNTAARYSFIGTPNRSNSDTLKQLLLENTASSSGSSGTGFSL